MSTLVYAGVVVAGAVTLLIEAREKFNSTLNATPFSEYPILRTTEISDLCTPRERNVSFVFYAMLYLVTYALILSSAELFTLLTKASSAGVKIGPVDTVVGSYDDPTKLLETQYGKPIFISAAIIAAFKVGMFQSVEQFMRMLAHRLAGVPRGVYLVIQNLNSATARLFSEKSSLKNDTVIKPFLSRFTDTVEKPFMISNDKSDVSNIITDLKTIDLLAPSLIGDTRVTYFPAAQLDTMSRLSVNLEKELDELRVQLEKAPATAEDRRKIKDATSTAAKDTIALFAVNYLRNDRAVTHVQDDERLHFIEENIRSAYAVEANSFSIAVLLAFVLSSCVVFWQWQDWATARTNEYRSDLRAEVRQIFMADSPEAASHGELETADLCSEAKKSDKTVITLIVQADLPQQSVIACEKAWNKVLETRRTQDWYRSLVNAPIVALPVLVSVALAAIAAIAGRNMQLENHAWPTGWSLRQPPFLRLILISILPAILAVFGVSATELVIQWVNSDFELQQNDIIKTFQSKGLFFILHAVIGFVVSIAVLVLSDLHDDQTQHGSVRSILADENGAATAQVKRKGLPWYATVLLGIFWGAMAMILYFGLVVISYGPTGIGFHPQGTLFPLYIAETINQGSAAMIFLILYAIFLEVTENGRGQPSRAKTK